MPMNDHFAKEVEELQKKHDLNKDVFTNRIWRKLGMLQNRITYLEDRVRGRPSTGKFAYNFAELSALRWVLKAFIGLALNADENLLESLGEASRLDTQEALTYAGVKWKGGPEDEQSVSSS